MNKQQTIPERIRELISRNISSFCFDLDYVLRNKAGNMMFQSGMWNDYHRVMNNTKMQCVPTFRGIAAGIHKFVQNYDQ